MSIWMWWANWEDLEGGLHETLNEYFRDFNEMKAFSTCHHDLLEREIGETAYRYTSDYRKIEVR